MADSPPKVTPRILKGFRDYLPAAMIPREHLIEVARRVYRSFGYSPIDTPTLEYLDILLGKGSDETDKQLFKFQRPDETWVGMRFDLTVPLARFAAQHINELGTPFKRYHIAPVWRGENTQRGRYREFMQCDFDIIGTVSPASDIETVFVIHDLFRALGFDQFTIHINDRRVLNGLLQKLGLAEKVTPILRTLDKLKKIGHDAVVKEMIQQAGTSSAQAEEIVRLAGVQGSNDEILKGVENLVAGNELGELGVTRLSEMLAALLAAGVPEKCLRLDVSIARGLDYYTGPIFETFLDRLPGIGSVCSGGRYDNLAELYTNQELPGVGASLGLDRLLAAMEELGMVEKTATPAPVFIPYFDATRLHDYLRLAARIRSAGIGVELYPEPKKLGQQLKYADRRGSRFAIIVGGDEFASGTCQVKDLAAKEQFNLPLEPDAASLIQELRVRLAKPV